MSNITPPPELVQEWLGDFFGCTPDPELSGSERFLATRAAQWGAEEELEACCAQISQCHLLTAEQRIVISQYLYACRRPEPPSPKKQALVALHSIAVKTEKLRTARRPKPQSLKQQAQAALLRLANESNDLASEDADDMETIRRALEALPDE